MDYCVSFILHYNVSLLLSNVTEEETNICSNCFGHRALRGFSFKVCPTTPPVPVAPIFYWAGRICSISDFLFCTLPMWIKIWLHKNVKYPAVLISGYINYVSHLEQMIFRFGPPESHTDTHTQKVIKKEGKKNRGKKKLGCVFVPVRTISIPGITPA